MAMLDENKGPADSRTVLVVEDDTGVQRVAAFMLRNLGFEVSLAKNGPEALALFDQGQHFDLLFTDVVMPEKMSGPELAAVARQRNPALKVLYMSGYGDSAIEQYRVKGSGGALLRKPYTQDDLARELEKVFEGDVA